MRRFLLTFAAIFVIVLNSCGKDVSTDSTSPDPEVHKIIEVFFAKYKTSSAEAVKHIFSTNGSFLPEQIKELQVKLTTSSQSIGRFTGTEQITTKKTSPSLIFVSYLVKHELQPLRFSFIFYKPKDDWMLYKFKFDDAIDAELEESGRIYFIK